MKPKKPWSVTDYERCEAIEKARERVIKAAKRWAISEQDYPKEDTAPDGWSLRLAVKHLQKLEQGGE